MPSAFFRAKLLLAFLKEEKMENTSVTVNFDKETAEWLKELADKNERSVASLVKELAIEALEDRSDRYLCKVAEEIDTPDCQWVAHEDIDWGPEEPAEKVETAPCGK